jgi:hypothetical protein
MSYKAQVIADETHKWLDNGLRFATYQQADRWAKRLASKWSAVTAYRVIESEDPVTEIEE